MLIFERVLSGPKTLFGERCQMDLIWFHTLAVPVPVEVNLSGIQEVG